MSEDYMRQYITNCAGQDLLITVWSDLTIEVAPRIDHTSWGPPLALEEQ